jgi:hypothetical protein
MERQQLLELLTYHQPAAAQGLWEQTNETTMDYAGAQASMQKISTKRQNRDPPNHSLAVGYLA